MNITFLIGNGFDLNLGLETEYKDFYPLFLEEIKELPDNNCVKKFGNMIEENYENWSNFEWAFAQKVSGTHTEVGTILKEFDELFSTYLKEQCEQLVYDTPEVKQEFFNFIVYPYKSLARADSQMIANFYNSHAKENHQYRFINFNYTNTLKELLFQVKFHPRHIERSTYQDYSAELLHIHGSLEEGYMIIGIDSLSQLADETMRDNPRLLKHCVKENINMSYGYGTKENEYEQLIKTSNIIYAYGIGFGETDKKRWNILRSWLEEDATHKLVIFKYNSGFPELDGMNKGLLLDAIDDARDEYLKLLGFESDLLETVRYQIFVADSKSVLKSKLKNKEKELATY